MAVLEEDGGRDGGDVVEVDRCIGRVGVAIADHAGGPDLLGPVQRVRHEFPGSRCVPAMLDSSTASSIACQSLSGAPDRSTMRCTRPVRRARQPPERSSPPARGTSARRPPGRPAGSPAARYSPGPRRPRAAGPPSPDCSSALLRRSHPPAAADRPPVSRRSRSHPSPVSAPSETPSRRTYDNCLGWRGSR